jgi:hypothetical protein
MRKGKRTGFMGLTGYRKTRKSAAIRLRRVRKSEPRAPAGRYAGAMEKSTARSLDEQRAEFGQRRLLAMPLAGTIAWVVIGVAGWFLTPYQAIMTLFGATGSIVYLGIFLSRYTGENFLDKSRPKNEFDRLFMATVGMSLLVYAIAIPFFMLEPMSLPLSVGILAGLMWLPMSWIIQHWVGVFHAVVRTVLVVVAYFVFPGHRITAIAVVIVAVYLVTIAVFEARWRGLQRGSRTS